MPRALLFARSLPLMSVRKRASARLHMTALLGSLARWPHWSSLLKPLERKEPDEPMSLCGGAHGAGAYPAVSISIRCCSVVPDSSLLRRPEKMPSCLRRALPAARLTSIISGCSISARGGMA